MKYWLEIMHRPFKDGTPRHALLTIKVPEKWNDEVEEIIKGAARSALSGDFGYWEIHPGESEQKALIARIADELGIVGSVWVEYWIKGAYAT